MEIGKFDIAPTCSRELFSDRCPCVSSRACRVVRAISCVPPRAFRLVRAVSRVLSCREEGSWSRSSVPRDEKVAAVLVIRVGYKGEGEAVTT